MKLKLKTAHKNWQDKYSHLNGALFFFSGFIFDLITLGRVDDYLNLMTQALFLVLSAFYIIYKYSNKLNLRFKIFDNTLKKYGDEVFHFCLGSLLSAFTIFYFKSSSLANSLLFMLALIIVLLVNELEFIKKRGLLTKAILYQLCLYSFLAMALPILIGFSGIWIFIFSLVFGFLVTFLITKILIRFESDENRIKNEFMRPSAFLALLFLTFYLLKIIPPVPLSTSYIGVFHNLEKSHSNYVLKHERAWWRFWHNGDQDFKARPSDKVVVFTKVFAPGGFSDNIFFHFMFKTKNNGYKTSDRIPMKIFGGRSLGFRGFAIKKNYLPGNWKVFVETEDGLELGRISFSITLDDSKHLRTFKELVQ